MAYINTALITDVLAVDLISKDQPLIDGTILKTDRDINTAVVNTGLQVTRIPVDNDGYTTSDVLYTYGENLFLFNLFKSVQGSGTQLDDAYKLKMEVYYTEVKRILKTLTQQTILGNTEVRQSNRGRVIPMY